MSTTNSTSVTAAQVQELREITGAGIMDCKKALQDAQGNIEKAKAILRDKGIALAAKRSGRQANDGLIGTYIHGGGKLGVMVELNCETDFVARTEDFQSLLKELCMQVAAAGPRWVTREQVPADALDEKRKQFEQEALKENKPVPVAAKIAEGKLDKYLSEFCLMEQPYVREPSGKVKIKDLLTETSAKLGEKVDVRRFVRFQVGGE